MNRWLRGALLLGLPLLLLPTLLHRRVSARRLSGPRTSSSPARNAEALVARARTIQELVDTLRAELAIPDPVRVDLVPENTRIVSVERATDQAGTFTLRLESDFIDHLSDEELRAVVAHELGHVWVFTHHPYLQTEELANQIALRIVDRALLERVYEKVWKRVGVRGTLTYLPAE